MIENDKLLIFEWSSFLSKNEYELNGQKTRRANPSIILILIISWSYFAFFIPIIIRILIKSSCYQKRIYFLLIGSIYWWLIIKFIKLGLIFILLKAKL